MFYGQMFYIKELEPKVRSLSRQVDTELWEIFLKRIEHGVTGAKRVGFKVF
jgi:hypothetical protein